MISQQIVNNMLAVDKKVYEEDRYLDDYEVKYGNLLKIRIPMASLPDTEYEFFLEVTQSSKKRLKITLHFQNINASLPLLRIDYGGTHKNPEEANKNVPDCFRAFTAEDFMEDDPHIHYYVEGQGLNWAIPLREDDFPIKTINNDNDKIAAIKAVCNEINLLTILNFPNQMELIL